MATQANPNVKLPWSKRASTWLNIVSGIAAVMMTQASSLGLPPEKAGWVHLACSMVIGAAQLYNQGMPKAK